MSWEEEIYDFVLDDERTHEKRQNTLYKFKLLDT